MKIEKDLLGSLKWSNGRSPSNISCIEMKKEKMTTFYTETEINKKKTDKLR